VPDENVKSLSYTVTAVKTGPSHHHDCELAILKGPSYIHTAESIEDKRYFSVDEESPPHRESKDIASHIDYGDLSTR
jgi:hypothetical protein